MNHKNLSFDFCPKINFIHGPNGSGKSAIAAAMMCCLGASARDTNRGSALSSLIQTGKDSAHVKVVLSNDGQDAFQPDKWGVEIVIERHLKRGAGSSYKIYGLHVHELIAAPRFSLTRIILRHSVQGCTRQTDSGKAVHLGRECHGNCGKIRMFFCFCFCCCLLCVLLLHACVICFGFFMRLVCRIFKYRIRPLS